jgi:hypothetical protein
MCRALRGIGHRPLASSNLIYTGAGSRQTPEPVLEIMTFLGRELAGRNWLLRSGGSPGADVAFETGCDLAGGRKEIYLPWPGFNGSNSPLFNMPTEALAIALRIHSGLSLRNHTVKKLRARNVCQILGASLNDPSDLVIAWTENELRSGGTATVLQIAEERRIPTLNLGEGEFARMTREAILERVLAIPP